MATSIRDLREWLKGRSGDEEIAVDEGGLTLVIVGEEEDYLEVGGVPEDSGHDLDEDDEED